jgi:hypothetical protein
MKLQDIKFDEKFKELCKENHVKIAKELSMPPQRFETFYKRLLTYLNGNKEIYGSLQERFLNLNLV